MITCEQIDQSIGKLYSCSKIKQYVRIRTPFLYPDGDIIELFLKEGEGENTLTDLGETMRWLRMQTPSMHKSSRQKQFIQDACLNHGVEFYKGMLTVRVKEGEEAQAVMRLSQAALRVSDLWFTLRFRVAESLADEVAIYLEERHISFDRGESLVGRSGRAWNVDFHTRSEKRSTLVYVLSTGSRANASRTAEHVLATWFDLNALKVGQEALRFVSLFDDTVDVWTEQEIKLLEEVSDTAFWSRPEEFIAKIAA